MEATLGMSDRSIAPSVAAEPEERQRVLARIADLRIALRAARATDLRETIEHAIADCERLLDSLDAG